MAPPFILKVRWWYYSLLDKTEKLARTRRRRIQVRLIKDSLPYNWEKR